MMQRKKSRHEKNFTKSYKSEARASCSFPRIIAKNILNSLIFISTSQLEKMTKKGSKNVGRRKRRGVIEFLEIERK